MPDTEGAVSFLEVGSAEAGKTVEFFASLFAWPFNPTGKGGGWFDAPGGKIGVHGDDPAWGILPYFRVPEIGATADRVRQLGGEAGDFLDEPGFGRLCHCRDSQGMRFGLHQPT